MSEGVKSGQWGQKGWVVLAVLCCIQLGAVGYYLWFLNAEKYLPAPFYPDKFDTFMDFFNPLYWANRDDVYTVWKAVYPPLNFVFLNIMRAVLIDASDILSSFDLRHEGGAVVAFLLVIYALVPAFIVTRSGWHGFSRTEKQLVYLVAVSATPMLFALERGNLLLFSLFFFPLLFGKSTIMRIAALALLVNLKPYFAPLFLVYVFKRRWGELAASLGVSFGIYLMASVILGSDLLAVPENMLSFSQKGLFSIREVLAMPSSVSAFTYVIGSDAFRNSSFFTTINSLVPLDSLCVVIEGIKWMVEAAVLVTLFRARKTLSDDVVLVALLAMITNLNVFVGGYTLVFYIALVPVFNRMRLRIWYLAILAFMALPLDFLTLMQRTMDFPNNLFYLVEAKGTIVWTLGSGTFARPILNLALLVLLAGEFLGESRKSNANNN